MTVPPSYTLFAQGRIRALVRDDVAARLTTWLVAPRLIVPPDARSIDTGRGGAFRIDWGDGLRLVVRPSRRGGLVGRLVTQTYLGFRPRPFTEAEIALAARARGVATPSVVGARVEGWGAYRGVVVTEEIRHARTLAAAMRETGDPAGRAVVARAAGRAVGALHAAGIEHADLNVDNLLVVGGSAAMDATVIDLDRARLHAGPLAPSTRRRTLERLARSWRKTMKEAEVPDAVRAAFRDGYAETGGRPCVS